MNEKMLLVVERSGVLDRCCISDCLEHLCFVQGWGCPKFEWLTGLEEINTFIHHMISFVFHFNSRDGM